MANPTPDDIVVRLRRAVDKALERSPALLEEAADLIERERKAHYNYQTWAGERSRSSKKVTRYRDSGNGPYLHENGELVLWEDYERLSRELAMSDAGGKLALADRDRLRAALEPFAKLHEARTTIYQKRGGNLDSLPDSHQGYDITASQLRLGIWRRAAEAYIGGSSDETAAERAVAAIAETIRGLTGARREAAVRILQGWNEMMRGTPASPQKATAECRGCKKGWERLGAWHWDSIGHMHECTAQKASGEPDKCPECGWFKGLHNAGCSRMNEGRAAAEVPR